MSGLRSSGLPHAAADRAYGPYLTDLHQRAAAYVDKIVRRARPADLPVEQPTRFELTINQTTAEAMGLTIPRSLLLQAETTR
jgi:putative tryptophan/tyrosine transport system substrate-binding protein